MKEDDKRKRKVVAFKPVTTVSERLKTYTTTWLDDDGNIRTTVHDGSFSPSPEPSGPTPYTPDPWLRITGRNLPEKNASGCGVALEADEPLQLQYSTDGKNWSNMQFEGSDDFYEWFTEEPLGVGESLYLRATESISSNFNLILWSDDLGAAFLDGNYNALFGPSTEDWERIAPPHIESRGCLIMHVPDFPGTVLDDGETYSIFADFLDFSKDEDLDYACPVSDDGENFNFHIGVTPWELYDNERIGIPTNKSMAMYMGNDEGINALKDTCFFVTSTTIDGKLDRLGPSGSSISGLIMPLYKEMYN